MATMRSRIDMMNKWIENHRDRDDNSGQTVAGLKLGIEGLNSRLDRLDNRVTSVLDGKTKQ